jgi:hypothetical protein
MVLVMRPALGAAKRKSLPPRAGSKPPATTKGGVSDGSLVANKPGEFCQGNLVVVVYQPFVTPFGYNFTQ